MNVLCHLVEFLAGSVILAKVKFNLHNVTLPRGWILMLLHQISNKHPDTRLTDTLLSCMHALMEALINGGAAASTFSFLVSLLAVAHALPRQDYLLFENRDLSELPAIRELFIPRM